MYSANLPKHIAIIMDGNGRWAKQRHLPRAFGHNQGAKVAKKIIEACANRHVSALTLFAFGCENWRRPADEVNHLMGLFLRSLQEETELMQKNAIQLRFIGNIAAFDKNLQQQIAVSMQQTAHNKGLKLVIAANYSGRWDIIQAAQKLIRQKETEITEEIFQENLSLSDLPEPDLFIRTSGEKRISNFLLWQLAYTELYFTDIFWPDFSEKEFEKALSFFASRERRFGFTSEQLPKDEVC